MHTTVFIQQQLLASSGFKAGQAFFFFLFFSFFIFTEDELNDTPEVNLPELSWMICGTSVAQA